MSTPWDWHHYLNGYLFNTPEMPNVRICARCRTRQCIENQAFFRSQHRDLETHRAYLNKLCTNIMMDRVRRRLTGAD